MNHENKKKKFISNRFGGTCATAKANCSNFISNHQLCNLNIIWEWAVSEKINPVIFAFIVDLISVLERLHLYHQKMRVIAKVKFTPQHYFENLTCSKFFSHHLLLAWLSLLFLFDPNQLNCKMKIKETVIFGLFHYYHTIIWHN